MSASAWIRQQLSSPFALFLILIVLILVIFASKHLGFVEKLSALSEGKINILRASKLTVAGKIDQVAPEGVATFNAPDYGIAPSNYQGQINGTINPTIATITTVAGNGTNGFAGDGDAAINAELNFPFGIALDPQGSIYIADAKTTGFAKLIQVALCQQSLAMGRMDMPATAVLQLMRR